MPQRLARTHTERLSIVLPALNEADNIPSVMASIPFNELESAGQKVEVILVDNASTDGTADVARALGARVVHQPERGYGHAYRAGFAAAKGDVVATGDADRTYPFEALPWLLLSMAELDAEFITTNRFGRLDRTAMKASHSIGNHLLSSVSRTLFRNGLRDSQSGMWIFRRYVWDGVDVRATGMAFSQEIKNAATRAGYRCLELPIEYRRRGGEAKLNAARDGLTNLAQLFAHRFRKVEPGRRPDDSPLTLDEELDRA